MPSDPLPEGPPPRRSMIDVQQQLGQEEARIRLQAAEADRQHALSRLRRGSQPAP